MWSIQAQISSVELAGKSLGDELMINPADQVALGKDSLLAFGENWMRRVASLGNVR